MEPVTIFALAVGFVGVFHLLSTAVAAVSKGRQLGVAATQNRRTDWYCFFTLSSLLGKEWGAADKRAQQDLSQDVINEEHKRRQQAQRPRLYAE